MKLLVAMLLLSAVGLGGCEQNGQSNSETAAVPPATVAPPPTTAELPAGSARITAAGGTVTLPRIVSANVPANALDEATLVEISQVPTMSASPDMTAVTEMFSVRDLGSNSVLVRLGNKQPNVPIRISINAGALYTTAVPAGFTVQILGVTENEADEDTPYPSWEIVAGTVDAAQSTVSFDADASFFAQRDAQGRHQGTFTLALSPTST